ncbi:MAG TPA: hypothetical protein PKA82_11760 [Pyrinomonadaceae bacterium]|mgnify:CR=1 FL=1|nr:hypothetical protein [Pyrinomonadaceae bacterium]
MKNLIYIVASIGFIVVIGGAVYEHTTMVPIWASAAPASLTMFQGEYAIAPVNFWRPVHPINLLLLIAALVFNWRTPRRKFLAVTIIGYVVILAITIAYFVPELMAITQTPLATVADTSLTARAQMWEKLSLVRLAVLVILAVCLLLGLTKTESGSK